MGPGVQDARSTWFLQIVMYILYCMYVLLTRGMFISIPRLDQQTESREIYPAEHTLQYVRSTRFHIPDIPSICGALVEARLTMIGLRDRNVHSSRRG